MIMGREEDCQELSLELSIGGKYGKPEKNGGFDEPQRRREIHALRRQEARRKREEKVKKSCGKMSDELLLEKQKFQGRVADREIREKDCVLEGKCRKNWGGDEVGLSLFSLYPKVQHVEAKNLSDSENSSNVVKSLEQSSSAVSDYSSLSPKGGSNTDTGCIDSHDSSPRQTLTRSSSTEEGTASEGPSSRASPQMPCVLATGNGPNARIVIGFLYRYNTTEVSIVCVCHGTSFSPGEFVKHAGGVDVTHPLRHITVMMN